MDAVRPRILFLRPDHIGDVLLTLPAVAALRRALPAAHLAYAASAASAAVASRCPHVDATLSVPFPPVARGRSDGKAWVRTAGAQAPRLARFDAALVVRPDDPWSGRLVAAAGVPVRIGFDMPRTRPYLTDAVRVWPGRHVSFDGFDLADALLDRIGAPARATRRLDPSFVPSDDDEAEARTVLSEAGAPEAPVVLHPGSGWAVKNWPARRWRRVSMELALRTGSAPVVAGTAAEAALVRDVAEGTSAIDLAGRLSLGGLAAVHRRARLVVTTDSGAMHLAAAVGAPVVALFGPGDPWRFAPLAPSDRIRIVRAGLECSPCEPLERPPCGATTDPECVRRIGVEDVLDATAELLGYATVRASESRP